MMLRLLVANGADVNAANGKGETPLFYAIYMKREDIVAMLLKAGARLDTRTADGRSPLELAQAEKADRIATLLKSALDLKAFLE